MSQAYHRAFAYPLLDISTANHHDFGMSKKREHLTPVLCLLLLLPLALVGCGADSSGPAARREGPVRIVATTSIIADAARRIAGEHAKVEALMGPGVDPHLYKASESDVRRLGEAD